MIQYIKSEELRALKQYRDECPIVFKPSGKNARLDRWEIKREGALSHEDGKLLYALCRDINAKHVLELGTFAGDSTNYLAEAVWKNHGVKGRVDTVDLVWYWGGVLRGRAIKWRNRCIVRQHKSDAWKYLAGCYDESLDLIFEDTSHSYEDTLMLATTARDRLRSGGVLAVHDANVREVPTCRVYEALQSSCLDFSLYPSYQGLAIWRKP